jgi:hypothetical protein
MMKNPAISKAKMWRHHERRVYLFNMMEHLIERRAVAPVGNSRG